MGAKKRIQLRRCIACQRVGHNRATCTYSAQTTPVTTKPIQAAVIQSISGILPKPVINNYAPSKTAVSASPQPLHFFVHHVNYDATQSPHVLNLKKEESVWDGVTTSKPEKNQTLYHTYHQVTPTESPLPPAPIAVIPTITVSPIIPEAPKKTWQEKTSELIYRLRPPAKEAPFTVNLSIPTQPAQLAPQLLQTSFEEKEPLLQRLQPIVSGMFNKQRLALAGVLLLVTIVIPGPARSYYNDLQTTKNTIVKDSSAAFVALHDSTIALKQADVPTAQQATDAALLKFNSILHQLEDKRLLRNIASLIPSIGGSLASREKIIMAGQEISLGNKQLLEGIKQSQDQGQKTLTIRLQTVLTQIRTALPNYERANQLFSEVDVDTLPLEYQAQFNEYKKLFGAIVSDFKTIDELGNNLLSIFGGEGRRRYVLIFQNPHEIRATGGFIGSFATLELKDGQIVKLDIPAGGSYDVQGQLKKFVEPPVPLLLANKRWEMQDANWFPHFPASAEKILWFYRHSYGVTADGVIAINASVLERLLSIIGPVSDEKRAITLDSENVIPVLQKIVEEGPEKKLQKPKQILSDLAPELVRSITSTKPENILPLLSTLQEALGQKEIQAYFTDAATQETIANFGWSGSILPTSASQDYLMVVNSNIQGQKSDAKIEQTISHQAVVSQDGTVINNIVITRKHTGERGEKLYGQRNIDYIRTYVPEGSELLIASGFTWPDERGFRAPEKWYEKDAMLTEIEKESFIDPNSGTRVTKEFSKTAFANWIITEPGETSQIQFTYRLPFKIIPEISTANWEKILKPFKKELTEYQLLVQRQSGSKSAFESQIIFPESWHTSWSDGDGMTLASNGARLAPRPLVKDTVWSLIMER